MSVTDEMGANSASAASGTGFSTTQKVVAIAAAVLLVLSLAANAFLYLNSNSLEAQVDLQGQLLDEIYDGEFDFSHDLFDAGSSEIIRQSIRDAVIRYADAEGNYLGSTMVTAIVVSDEFVLVPAAVIPPADSDVQILVAGMQSSSLDGENAVEEFDLSVTPTIDDSLGVAAIRRSADPVLDVVPLLDALGDVREISVDRALVAVGTMPLSTQAPNEVGRQITSTGKVDLIAGTRIGARGIPAFQPVYALRDGTPELIGISIAGQGVTPIVTVYDLEPLLTLLGVQVEFPE